MSNFPWFEELSSNNDVSWQTTFFTETALNFITSGTIKVSSRDPRCLENPLKPLLREKYTLFKNYKKNTAFGKTKRIEFTIFETNVK